MITTGNLPPPAPGSRPVATASSQQQGSLFPVAPTPPSPAKPVYVQPPEQQHLWPEPEWVHLTQNPSPLVPDAAPYGNGNCGPTSAVMALRMVGLDVPGFNGEDRQSVITKAREMATGRTNNAEWTHLDQNIQTLREAGAQVTLTSNLNNMLEAVRGGEVGMIAGNGNRPETWTSQYLPPNYPKDQWDGHIVTVSRYNPERGTYTINDPGLPRPVYVSAHQVHAFAGWNDDTPEANGIPNAIIVSGPANAVRKGIHVGPANSTELPLAVDPGPGNE